MLNENSANRDNDGMPENGTTPGNGKPDGAAMPATNTSPASDAATVAAHDGDMPAGPASAVTDGTAPQTATVAESAVSGPPTVPAAAAPPKGVPATAAGAEPSLTAGEMQAHDRAVEAQMSRMSRRSFLWSVVAVGSAATGWKWLTTRRDEDGIPWPFRRALQTNEQIARDLFSSTRLAPTFPASRIDPERVNGDIGLGDWDASSWQLTVEGLASGETLMLSMKDIKALPRVEMITQLKCIEGWSIVQKWAGARFSDFAAKVGPATRSGNAPDLKRKPGDVQEYVGLETPDGAYYVGLDTETALHPQTLLCYEMNGKPLTAEHGAPLRLVTPLKYGIKNIKRIGTIRFVTERPADYWAEQGYDWYAGH